MADSLSDISVQIAAINRASAEIRKIAADINKLDAAAGQTRGFDRLNKSFGGSLKQMALLGGGFIGAQSAMAAFSGGLRGTIGSAIAFESSFAGVRKTVDATEAEFSQLEQANRDMAKSLPLSVNGLNDITALAGQLGVRGVDNLTKFTRTVADLGNTTNLATEEAAQSFAQIANVVGLPIKDVDRLGSAIVDLGNKSATTERDIVAFTQRIAGAGKIAGLTAAELAGIGTAFASTGVEAEAGGTAIQKVLIGIRKASAEGGAELQVFADAAGMSAAEFQKLARSDGAEAFTQFVEGLGRAGEDAFQILEQLGLEDQRLIRSFLSVAGAGDLLRRSIDTGSDAFRENTALAEEAEKRYATTASQLKILKNNVTDVGISVGDKLLPAINEGAAGSADLVSSLDPLVPVLKSTATAAVGVGAAFAAIKLAGFAAQVQQQIALQAALARGMSATSVASALMPPPLLLIGGALVAADLASRKFTGGGLIEYFTGAKEKAEKAARATALLNDQMERLTVLQSGLGEELGEQRFLEEQILNLVRATQALADAREAAADTRGFREQKNAIDATADEKEQVDALRKSIQQLNPSYIQLALLVGDNEAAQAALSKEIDAAQDAYNAAQRTSSEYGAAIDSTAGSQRDFQRELRNSAKAAAGQSSAMRDLTADAEAATKAYDDLTAAVGRVEDAFDIRTIEEIRLDRQIAEIDALIAGYEAAGQEIPADLQKMRDQLDKNRSAAQATTDAVVLNFEELAAEMRAQGDKGIKAADDLSKSIAGLPEDVAIDIITTLERTDADEAIRIVEQLTKMAAAGISIPVAFELLGQQSAPRQFGSRANGFAEGGFVTANKQGELAMLHGNELVLPLDDRKRTMDLLGQLGARGFEDGGFTDDAFLNYVRGGGLPPGLTSGASGGSANGLMDLAAALSAADMSAVEFIATLELFDEEAAAAEQMAEESRRAAIDLTKLAIVLGKEGISGEAFVAQQNLIGLRDAFLKSGMAADEFILHIQGITQAMLAQGKALAKKSGKDVTSFASTTITSDGVNYSIGGNLTDEGFEKVIKDLPDDVKEELRRQRDESGVKHSGTSSYPKLHDGLDYVPRDMTANLQRGERVVPAKENKSWGGGMTFNGPVTVNARGSVDEALRDMALQVR